MTRFQMAFDEQGVELVDLGLQALEEKVRGVRAQLRQGVAATLAFEQAQAQQAEPPGPPPRRLRPKKRKG